MSVLFSQGRARIIWQHFRAAFAACFLGTTHGPKHLSPYAPGDAKELLMKIARQFVTYCLVGVFNTLVGLSIILALLVGLGWHYMVANAAGYVCGIALSFFLNRRMTFRDTALQGRAGRQAAPFLAVLAGAYGVQLAALYAMVEWWRVPEIPAQLVAMVIYTVAGFLGSRFLVFAERPPGS